MPGVKLLSAAASIGIALAAWASLSAAQTHATATACVVAPAKTGAGCFRVLEVPQGRGFRIRAVSRNRLVPPRRSASAQFGTVDASGNYRAPAELPPRGLDTITLFDAKGAPFARLHVQFIPDRGYDLPSAHSRVLHPVLAPDPVRDVPPARHYGIAGAQIRPSELDPGVRALAPDDFVIVSGLPVRQGTKCGVIPVRGNPNGPNTGIPSFRTIAGPWETQKIGEPTDRIATIFPRQTAMKVTWKEFSAVKVQYRDIYTYRDKAWVLLRTERWTRYGVLAFGISPTSVPLPGQTVDVRRELGFPSNGYKFDGPVEGEHL
ncbi:MAG: hypothetical protein SFX74_13570 [Fimbriimonadaceae bacterium]|nr:hypothetical protein [Fimbriimonadaceae bacterium]